MQLFTLPSVPSATLARPQAPAAPVAFFRSAIPSAPRPSARRLPEPPACALPETELPRDIASRFGRRIRELRYARGMTQMEVAVHFGIDRTFISDVERGRKSVCLPTLEIFALGFGVCLSDLLRGL